MIKKSFLTIIVLICLFHPFTASSSIINSTISPIADVYVDSQYPSSNRANLSYLEVGFHNFTLQNYTQIAYYLFDLSSFSCSGPVQLSVSASSYYSINISLHEVTYTNWSATTMTWDNKPDFNHSIVDSIDFNGTKYINFNLTSIVKQQKVSYALKAETSTSSPAEIESMKVNHNPPFIECLSFTEYTGSVGSTTHSSTFTSLNTHSTTTTSPSFDSVLLSISLFFLSILKKRKNHKS